MKEYEADTNASVIFALDSSASMDFGSGGVTKYDYGRFLIASLAWLSQQQGDRVGLVTFTGDIVDVVPPSTRHLQLLLHTLGRAKATGAGTLAGAGRHGSRTSPRAPASSCSSPTATSRPRQLGRAADALRMRGQDVIVFHLVDAAERDFPFTAATTFEDSESGDAARRCGRTTCASRYSELVACAPRRGGEAARRVGRRLRARGHRPAARPGAARLPRPPPRRGAACADGMASSSPPSSPASRRSIVPIVLHLRHRDKDTPQRFPSLMFLERLPIRTAQRRRITDWPLLLLRALALVLLVLAFARPVFSRGRAERAERAARGGRAARPLDEHGPHATSGPTALDSARKRHRCRSAPTDGWRSCCSTTRPRSRSRSPSRQGARARRAGEGEAERRAGRATPRRCARRVRSHVDAARQCAGGGRDRHRPSAQRSVRRRRSRSTRQRCACAR